MDFREYRGTKLSNGMKVLIISDSTTIKSAAAMVVGVGAVKFQRFYTAFAYVISSDILSLSGAMNDDNENPGVANIMRYILSTSSERYPKKYEFKQYLRERGGQMNSPLTNIEAEHK